MGKLANQLLALNAEKHAIREAINRKGGELSKAAPLTDYPAAIDAIRTDIDNAHGLFFRVIFIDYDGTVLKDVTLPEGGSVAPPAVPAHEHLSFHGWNRSTEALNDVRKDMCVGALYDVENGSTWIRVSQPAGVELSFYTRTPSTPGVIRWGDGTETATTVGTSSKSYAHTYAADFDGWIEMENVYLDDSSNRNTFKEILVSGNLYNSSMSTELEAVCIGVGTVIDTKNGYVRCHTKMKGFVAGGNVGNLILSASTIIGLFYLSEADDDANVVKINSSSYWWFPILDMPGLTLVYGGASLIGAKTVVLSTSATPALPTSSFGDSVYTIHFRGSTFPGGNFTTVKRIIIEPGAVPLADVTIDTNWKRTFDDNPAALMTFVERLGAVSAALTITFKACHVSLRDTISDILTAKGYTVAFS